MPGLPWSPQFMAAYDVAHAAYAQPDAVPLGASRTHRGLAQRRAGPLLRQRELSARAGERHARAAAQPAGALAQGSRRAAAEAVCSRAHIQSFISKLESPSVQRNMLRAIRHFTKFAVGAGLIATDPAVSVDPRQDGQDRRLLYVDRGRRRQVRSAASGRLHGAAGAGALPQSRGSQVRRGADRTTPYPGRHPAQLPAAERPAATAASGSAITLFEETRR